MHALLWASRRVPFSVAAEQAGAFRTVDADTFEDLTAVVAHQEEIAAQADDTETDGGQVS